jgi:hypothetical protein
MEGRLTKIVRTEADVNQHPENPDIMTAGFNMLCGRRLGSGINRDVFVCALDPTLVVKVEPDVEHRSFANVLEHGNWEAFCDTKEVAKWLAPCVRMSPCGLILLQKRVTPLRRSELPERVPNFLTDLKLENFGLYEGRVVCCDYSIMITRIAGGMQVADWVSDQ